MVIKVELLSQEEAIAYWDTRHQRAGNLQSGGHISYDETTNQMFYTRRLSLLLEMLGHHSSRVAPMFILDAGCGKGWFSRELARFGHQVDGIDTSESALAECRALGGGPRYFRSTLAEWRSPWLYDAVAAIDVVFHILEHDDWERSVRNLASLVRMRGQLIVSDWGEPGDRVLGNYMVVRGRDEYLPLMKECGLRFTGWHPYDFRHNLIGFYVFTRIG